MGKTDLLAAGALAFILGAGVATLANKQEEKAVLAVDCSQFGRTATLVMDLRQSNIPYKDVVQDESKRDPYFVSMVKRAYEKDVYKSDSYKNKAIEEFAELETNLCKDMTR